MSITKKKLDVLNLSYNNDSKKTMILFFYLIIFVKLACCTITKKCAEMLVDQRLPTQSLNFHSKMLFGL